MATDIQQRPHLAVLAANDEERLTAETRGEEIPGLAHLAVVSHAMPVAQDQPTHLALEKLRVAVELAAERVAGALGRDRTRTAIGALRCLDDHGLRCPA